MTVTIITGWIAAILLFFNFATCLAMPWATKKIHACDNHPECKEEDKEKCKDKNKEKCEAISLCKYHKPIVFMSILAIIIHIIISLTTRLSV
ncbi:hypothetical protein HOD75_01795 [archaeon]|jgi:hypothetical protein|nr:hypothetical protein [archaeon]MBT4241610.1 hypothetical protein [archaeon]MBT4418005.1 hypothetical protein [archaeon]